MAFAIPKLPELTKEQKIQFKWISIGVACLLGLILTAKFAPEQTGQAIRGGQVVIFEEKIVRSCESLSKVFNGINTSTTMNPNGGFDCSFEADNAGKLLPSQTNLEVLRKAYKLTEIDILRLGKAGVQVTPITSETNFVSINIPKRIK